MRAWLASLGRNKSLKLLSLFLAVALWLAVGGEERTETTLNLALEIVNLPQDLMITSEIPTHIQVRVSGPRYQIRTLTQSRLTYSLDLAHVKPGRQSFPLGVGSFHFPRGVQVIRVQPNPLVLTFAQTVTLTLPLQPVFSGELPEGYELKRVTLKPAKVRVKGPAQELEGLQAIPTVPLDLSSLTRPTTLSVDLDFKDLHLTLLDQAPILAELDIGPRIVQRTLENLPVSGASAKVKLSPDRVSVTLSGPWEKIKNLDPGEIKAWISPEGLPPGRHQLQVQVRVPEGLTLEKVSPANLAVRVLRP